jgi:hypothetical protein
VKCWPILLLVGASSLFGQVIVESGKQAHLQVPGATAAVSLDQHIAETSLADNVLTVTGVDTGDTRVVALREGGIWEFSIHVAPGAPHYPPGFAEPEDPSKETGSIEMRFSTDEQHLETIVDLEDRGLLKTTQVHLATASFAAVGERSAFVPSAYYRVVSRHRDFTLLDRTVNESQLTLDNVVVRGIHLDQDDWHFHAGYTASADFADVLIPTEKELAAGLSANVWVTKNVTVTPAIYFLRSIDLTDGQQHSGLIASLRGDAAFSRYWKSRAEIAFGRGLAYAGEIHHNTVTSQLNATVMQRKLSFPSLRTSSLPGLSAAAYWTQLFSPRWSLYSGGSINDIVLQTIRQNSQIAFANLRYKFSRSWSVGTGFNYGMFAIAGSPAVKQLTLPQQVNFDHGRFGAGSEYRFATISDSFSNGAGFTETVNLKLHRLQLGGYFDWQRDALSVNSLSSQSPALQQALQRLGIVSVKPEQLAALLQDAAFLHTLGFASQAQIVTVPRRLQQGGSLTWSSAGAHPHQLSASVLSSTYQLFGAQTNMYSVTAAYNKQIGESNYLQTGYSLVQAGAAGREGQNHLVSISFRHTFSRASTMFAAERKTSINGTVFIDHARSGAYTVGSQPVTGAVVILDGEKRVVTDASGHFHFSVSEGNHEIQLQYHSDREHYFTTPPEAEVAGGSSVDFGIAFSQTDLWGYIQDDTGSGLGNVKLQVKSAFGNRTLSTDQSGKFDLPDVEPGSYQIEVDRESVGLGYSTDTLAPIEVRTTAVSAPHPVLKIPAVRIFTGKVTIYSPSAERYVPVAGATLRIAQLGRTTTTNAQGRFVFSGLPAGDLEVTLAEAQSSLHLTIRLPARPVTLQRDFRISSLNGEIASNAGIESR